MISLTCSEIAGAVNGSIVSGYPQKRICGVSIDSRKVKKDDLFVPLKGENADGHRFVEDAFKNGAVASFCEHHYEKNTKKA